MAYGDLNGTRWVSKDGKRRITIESDATGMRGERALITVNEDNGVHRHLSYSGLLRKFVQRESSVVGYYGTWEKLRGPYRGTQVQITGYITKVAGEYSLQGRVTKIAEGDKDNKLGDHFSTTERKLLADWERVEE